MKKINFSTKVNFCLLGLVLLFITACSSTETEGSTSGDDNNTDEVYTINAATALDETNILTTPFKLFKELVEEKSGGRININYVGGPEAIPGFNQGEAIRSGALDLTLIFSSYYAELVPEGLAINYSELTYEEELERRTWDYLNELHEGMNAITLGRAMEMGYGIYTRDKVESSSDLKGLRIRGTTTYIPTLEAFGAEVLSIEGGEIYNALERGMVNGVAWTELGIGDLGIEKEINYQILPKFNKVESLWLMNLDTYNQLPEDLQEVLTSVAKEVFYQSQEPLSEYAAEEQQRLENAGVEEITLTDSEEFLQTAVESSWEWLGSRVNDVETLESYFRK